MFSCYVHNWFSRDNECPSCIKYKTSSSDSSTEFNFTNSAWPYEKQLHEEINQLRTENAQLKEKLAIAVEALEKITLKETMCIYGTSDMPSDSDEAFRLGSNLAWVETAELAKEAIAKYEEWRKGDSQE